MPDSPSYPRSQYPWWRRLWSGRLGPVIVVCGICFGRPQLDFYSANGERLLWGVPRAVKSDRRD